MDDKDKDEMADMNLDSPRGLAQSIDLLPSIIPTEETDDPKQSTKMETVPKTSGSIKKVTPVFPEIPTPDDGGDSLTALSFLWGEGENDGRGRILYTNLMMSMGQIVPEIDWKYFETWKLLYRSHRISGDKKSYLRHDDIPTFIVFAMENKPTVHKKPVDLVRDPVNIKRIMEGYLTFGRQYQQHADTTGAADIHELKKLKSVLTEGETKRIEVIIDSMIIRNTRQMLQWHLAAQGTIQQGGPSGSNGRKDGNNGGGEGSGDQGSLENENNNAKDGGTGGDEGGACAGIGSSSGGSGSGSRTHHGNDSFDNEYHDAAQLKDDGSAQQNYSYAASAGQPIVQEGGSRDTFLRYLRANGHQSEFTPTQQVEEEEPEEDHEDGIASEQYLGMGLYLNPGRIPTDTQATTHPLSQNLLRSENMNDILAQVLAQSTPINFRNTPHLGMFAEARKVGRNYF